MVKDMATCDVNLVQNALGIQQTGPRTVIVPADPIIWSANTSYEYLTLVATTDFGQAYISKRDVPAGTPLTNTTYWIPAASYNAQLAAINKNLTAVTADVSAIEEKMPTFESLNYISLKYWDVDDSGSTNVATKVQQAVNYCAQNSFVLYIPEGTYLCNTTINLPDGVTIIGQGQRLSVFKFPKGRSCFVDSKPSGYSQDITLKNFGIVCSEEEWHTDNYCGIDITPASCDIENISVRWMAEGIRVRNIPSASYEDVTHTGPVRRVSYCDVYGCNNGFHNTNQDMMYDNVTCGSCENAGLYNESGGCALVNAHFWGIKQYGLLNGGSINVSNLEIESDTNRSASNSAFIRQWGVKSVMNIANLRIWNIYSSAGFIVSNTSGICTISNMNIAACSDTNTSKTCPAICYVNSDGGGSPTVTDVSFTIDSSYESIVGAGYTNTGGANVLCLQGFAPAESSFTQGFITKTGGNYKLTPVAI